MKLAPNPHPPTIAGFLLVALPLDAELTAIARERLYCRRGVLGEVAVLETDMADARKRRWFRFSLRTMLVAFTVVAVWLGWNVHAVHQRRDAVDAITGRFRVRSRPDYDLAASKAANDKADSMILLAEAEGTFSHIPHKTFEPTVPYGVSILRQWLGDEPRWLIAYTPGPDPEKMARLFPEAIIVVPTESDE